MKLDNLLECLINETWGWSINIRMKKVNEKYCLVRNGVQDIHDYINKNYVKRAMMY